MNDSELLTSQRQTSTNRIQTNLDHSAVNLLAQDSQISIPKDQDQADYQEILTNWDSLSYRTSPDLIIDNKRSRINPRKAIHRPSNQKNDLDELVGMGTAQESALAAQETSAERARRNWQRVKERYKNSKAQLK